MVPDMGSTPDQMILDGFAFDRGLDGLVVQEAVDDADIFLHFGELTAPVPSRAVLKPVPISKNPLRPRSIPPVVALQRPAKNRP
jgi:hypothetical protein